MKLLDLTLPEPAANLAADEALLELCEAGGEDELLRFWEPRQHFVVVGYSNKVRVEVNEPACRTRGIPILRRCSGGGTVLQGPGCLNYSLILRIERERALANVTGTNRYIMTRQQAAIGEVLRRSGTGILPVPHREMDRQDACPTGGRDRQDAWPAVRFEGHTDLAVGGLKFSGNAQRRKQRCLLFHGTFLLQFDLALVEEVLRLPSRQPVYRQNRSHREFLVNLGVPAPAIKEALRQTWGAIAPLPSWPADRTAELVREKYETAEWNRKF